MEYFLNDINVYIINDAIDFCIEDNSILDNGKKVPIYGKSHADIFEYIIKDGKGVYYVSKLPMLCVDLLKKEHIKGNTSKEILDMYRRTRCMGFTIGDYIQSCKYTKISKEQILDLYTDIANGFDRKKALVRVAKKLNTDDLGAIPKKFIDDELKCIKKERANKQYELYSKLEKEI